MTDPPECLLSRAFGAPLLGDRRNVPGTEHRQRTIRYRPSRPQRRRAAAGPGRCTGASLSPASSEVCRHFSPSQPRRSRTAEAWAAIRADDRVAISTPGLWRPRRAATGILCARTSLAGPPSARLGALPELRSSTPWRRLGPSDGHTRDPESERPPCLPLTRSDAAREHGVAAHSSGCTMLSLQTPATSSPA